MAETCVKLRSDLEIRPESPQPHSAVVVKDSITGRFYRFAPIQAAVLQRLDGKTNLNSIAAVVSEQFQTQVLQSQVEEFVTKLHGLLLLDHPAIWSKLDGAAKPRHRFIHSLLSIKLHVFSPDHLLAGMERRLRFCFGPVFATIAWLSIAAGAIISILNWESMYISMGTLLSLYSIPLILIIAFCIMTVHEFAHGLTLKHFGGKIDEMGLLFLYFIPAFYCNVSDAWMLNKRERIRVSLAGSGVQFILWAWATILWRLLAPETFASRVCLIAIAFSGIQTLLNFNPLIKLDGYYLLSDYLEIPNLRQKAFRYWKTKLSAGLLGTRISQTGESGAREKRIYAVYGASSFLFSLGLAWVVLERLSGFLVREFEGWGIVMVSTLCLMVAPAASKENVLASGRFLVGVTTRIKRAPHIVLALALFVAGGFLPWELKVAGDFTILPINQVSVSPEVSGTLKNIYADEGHRIHRGDVLAEIENLELSNSFEETRGELQTQKAALELLRAGARPEEIDRAKRLVATKTMELTNSVRVDQERKVLLETIDKKQAELQNASLNLERTTKLLKNGLVARNEADRDQTVYEVQKKELSEAQGQLKVLDERTDNIRHVKQKELEQAQSELKILLAGSRQESIQGVEAQVNKLDEKLKILTQQLEYLKIRSPIDGVVTTPYLRNRIGEFLDKGDRLCEVVSEGTVVVEMPVPEKEIADVQPGFPITLKVRGYPRNSFEARVKSIAPIAVQDNSEKKVVVQGELTNPDGLLKAGMTGVGKILCGKRIIAELLTRRAVRWLRTEFWEYLP